MSSPWTAPRRAALRAFCDTVFPDLQEQPDPDGFWNRSATELGVDVAFAEALDASTLPEVREGTLRLIDVFASLGLVEAADADRERILRTISASSPAVAAGVRVLVRGVAALCYTLTDPLGHNANWPAIAYPGPPRQPVARARTLTPLQVDRDGLELSADVCIVGSGAGGGVLAGELSKRGLDVIVLEAGGYFSEGDFDQLERSSYRNMFWRGGYVASADNNIRLAAAATLGGGTVIDWENCVRTPAWVREEWSSKHGLDGLVGADFDAHLAGVCERLSINADCSDLNGPHLRLEAGTRRLNYRFERAYRNVDRANYDPARAGFHGFGDSTGNRQSVTNTYLQDAQARGARILVHTRAERISTEAGRASGVDAVCTRENGERARVRVRAKNVVVAGGALETPALLLRSGIGGPAAGQYLRLHPCVNLLGLYAEDQRSWWGPPQAALCDEFMRAREDHGFLIEGVHHGVGLLAAALPWRSGREHKQLMRDSHRCAFLIGIVRDHGHGSVSIAADGSSVVRYPVNDALDHANLEHATLELLRIHEAAGASNVYASTRCESLEWQRGVDITSWLRTANLGLGGANPVSIFSAHQMGSARMGKDPASSVCNPDGELHDVRGVWIGDTSAFPTAVGVNPMLSCMALASRTAARIAK